MPEKKTILIDWFQCRQLRCTQRENCKATLRPHERDGKDAFTPTLTIVDSVQIHCADFKKKRL